MVARLFLLALLALVGCASAFTAPSAAVSRSIVSRATKVEMIGKKAASKPKKAVKKNDFWATVRHHTPARPDIVARAYRTPVCDRCTYQSAIMRRPPQSASALHLLNLSIRAMHSHVCFQVEFRAHATAHLSDVRALVHAVRPRRFRHGRP